MKNSIRFLLALAAGLMLLTAAASPKDFKGVIIYKITLSGDNVADEMKAMMPKSMTMTIRGNMAKSEMITGMGKTVSISNGEDKTNITLLDMMGQKIAVKTTNEEIKAEMAKQTPAVVEVMNETKDILGYACKKAIVHVTDETGGKQDITVFFTDELGTGAINFDNAQFKDINGVMLEFEMVNPQFTMHFIATSVEKKNVAETEFAIPEGYQIKTKDEMKSMFGGMGE
jgi:GLPGLI family protein